MTNSLPPSGETPKFLLCNQALCPGDAIVGSSFFFISGLKHKRKKCVMVTTYLI